MGYRINTGTGVASFGSSKVVPLTFTTIFFAASPYSAADGEVIEVNTSSGAVSVILPDLATAPDAKVVVLKSSLDGNAVTVTVNGGTNINGSLSYVLAAGYDSAIFVGHGIGGGYFVAAVAP